MSENTANTPGFWKTTGIVLGLVDRPAETRESFSSPTPANHQGAIVPPSRAANAAVSVESALSISAVYRSISILVTSVSQMDLGVYRTISGITSELDAPALIKNPNVNDTAQGFVEETVFSLAAHGNAYWRIYRNGPGEAAQNIEVLDPSTVTWTKRESDGKVVYHQGNTDFRPEQIKHLRLLRRPGFVDGLGPIQSAAKEIEAALRLREFADEWFNTSGVPLGYLTTDQVLGAGDAEEIVTAWRKFLSDHNMIGILDQGYDFKHLNLKPADAQFIEVQDSVVVNIARLFGVPAMHLLAVLNSTSNTYLNLEQANLVFLQTTLARYMNEIENALSDLLPRGQKVEFKEEGLLRMDSLTKWKVIDLQVKVGYTNGNELRGYEGKAPIALPAPPAAPEAPADDEETAEGEEEQ